MISELTEAQQVAQIDALREKDLLHRETLPSRTLISRAFSWTGIQGINEITFLQYVGNLDLRSQVQISLSGPQDFITLRLDWTHRTDQSSSPRPRGQAQFFHLNWDLLEAIRTEK